MGAVRRRDHHLRLGTRPRCDVVDGAADAVHRAPDVVDVAAVMYTDVPVAVVVSVAAARDPPSDADHTVDCSGSSTTSDTA